MDYSARVRVKPNSTGVDIADIKMNMGPLDEAAAEEAVRLKEKEVAAEVVTISRKVAQCQGTLHTAMAISADRDILVEADAELQPLAVAKLLGVLMSREQPTLILLSKQVIDDDVDQTGQVPTVLADLPQTTCASKIDVIGGKVTVTYETDGGLETVSLTLPIVVMTDLRLNEPRYATLPNIMKAKKKPLDIVRPEDLSVDVASRLKTLRVSELPRRSVGVMVTDMVTLVGKPKNKAKVI